MRRTSLVDPRLRCYPVTIANDSPTKWDVGGPCLARRNALQALREAGEDYNVPDTAGQTRSETVTCAWNQTCNSVSTSRKIAAGIWESLSYWGCWACQSASICIAREAIETGSRKFTRIIAKLNINHRGWIGKASVSGRRVRPSDDNRFLGGTRSCNSVWRAFQIQKEWNELTTRLLPDAVSLGVDVWGVEWVSGLQVRVEGVWAYLRRPLSTHSAWHRRKRHLPNLWAC